MKCRLVKLGDVCTKIGSGATPRGGSTVYISEGTSFIRSQNVYNLQFSYDGLVYINDEAAEKLKGVTLEKDDVLINITGDSIARSCIIPDNLLPARVNQHVCIIRPKQDILNSRFLNYYLVTPYMQAYMLGLCVGKGTSRNAMTKEMVANFEVPCPNINKQKMIVRVLSAYDDLIENNRKQIKLLEEAAQRLYKEWFVDLHFPGYEDTKIMDGVPEGWYKSVVSDIAEFKRGKTITQEYAVLGTVPVIGGGLEPAYYHNSSNTETPVITVSASGANAGFVRLYNTKVYASDCSFLDNRSTKHLYFVYSFLKKNMKVLASLQKGSAQPHVYAKDLNALKIIIPKEELLSRYTRVAEKYFSKIAILEKSIIDLEEARNRLLPKLMNGEIEV